MTEMQWDDDDEHKQRALRSFVTGRRLDSLSVLVILSIFGWLLMLAVLVMLGFLARIMWIAFEYGWHVIA